MENEKKEELYRLNKEFLLNNYSKRFNNVSLDQVIGVITGNEERGKAMSILERESKVILIIKLNKRNTSRI
jgi:hypothetical protein